MTNVIYESNFSAKDTPEYFNTLNEAIAYTNEWADCTADFTPCVKKIIVVLDDFGQCIDHEEPECCWTMKNPYVAEDCLEDVDPELDDALIDGESLLLESGLKLSFKDGDKIKEFEQLCRDLGIVTGKDLARFAEENGADDSNMLDKLKQYKADLGDDWKLEECSRKSITEGMPEDTPADDYYVITTTEGGKRYYIRNNIDFKNPPEDAYEWFTHDLDKAQHFSSREMAGEYFVERDLGSNVFALGDNGRKVRYYDYVKTPYECWLIDTGSMKEACSERKPIPEGMTIEELVGEMEENEDTVECTWCNELFDKSECRKEVNLGWLCSRCEMAIKSRGETLTFREGNYWDFLDEDASEDRNTPKDPHDHHDPDYSDEYAAEYEADMIDLTHDSRYDDALDDLD